MLWYGLLAIANAILAASCRLRSGPGVVIGDGKGLRYCSAYTQCAHFKEVIASLPRFECPSIFSYTLGLGKRIVGHFIVPGVLEH